MVSVNATRPPRQSCRGQCVKTGKDCGNWKGLNSDHFCKFHVPNALQCRGIAKSTGKRCRIKWDLNGNQFCEYHVCQVTNPKFPLDEATTPEELRKGAGIKAHDKAEEMCKPRCRGIAKSTGQRCKIDWKLNENQLCKYHTKQTPTFAKVQGVREAVNKPVKQTTVASKRQCRGYAWTTGRQCRIDWDLNANGFCRHHVDQHHRARL